MKKNFDKIKLVIWDLDDTFWSGTLSEGAISPIKDNINLVHDLTDCGIINMICSKNDSDSVLTELTKLGVNEYFVFNSINWLPKGHRIAEQIKIMGLRASNVLFIDDNIQNLKESEYAAEGIMTMFPREIPSLREYVNSLEKTDLEHKRLNQYKVLEKKTEAASCFADNIEFLYSSNIIVEINYHCESEIKRISELVLRTNQLNFTKRRDSIQDIQKLIKDPDCLTGYVSVKDDFGDYGIVGFFAIKNKQCIHFLFSCRTIGQGVEQYVYAVLGYPALEVVNPVIGEVNHAPAPQWINQKQDKRNGTIVDKNRIQLLFKGACDLSQICSYLNSDAIVEELTYIGNRRKNHIEFHNHSQNYLSFPFLSQDDRDELVGTLLFADDEMFDTKLYDPDVALVVVSTMMEANLGIYQRKKDGLKIAALESSYPLTEKKYWDSYINHEIFDAQNDFSREWLETFSNEWEFLGGLTPDAIIENARELLKRLPVNTKVCYILGSELEYVAEQKPHYKGRHLQYARINMLFRQLSQENPRVLLLDVNDFIKDQSDFTDNINHWQRRIYYQMAGKLNELITLNFNLKTSRKNKLFLFITDIKYRMVRAGFLETKLWKTIRKVKKKREI